MDPYAFVYENPYAYDGDSDNMEYAEMITPFPTTAPSNPFDAVCSGAMDIAEAFVQDPIYRVVGAGATLVNGLYIEGEVMDSVASYHHSQNSVVLLRHMLAGVRFWFLIDSSSSETYYRLRSDANTPPLDLVWECHYYPLAVLPAPHVEAVDVFVPRPPSQSMLAALGADPCTRLLSHVPACWLLHLASTCTELRSFVLDSDHGASLWAGNVVIAASTEQGLAAGAVAEFLPEGGVQGDPFPNYNDGFYGGYDDFFGQEVTLQEPPGPTHHTLAMRALALCQGHARPHLHTVLEAMASWRAGVLYLR